jgi:3',5'-nucleoside bisphosphate phosphatase
MLQKFCVDLHIHTCLSPCGDLQMSPQKIIDKVLDKNIEMIGICDHNSSENVPALVKAAHGKNVVVLPGMEICSQEEVHVISLFENMESAFRMQSTVYKNLHGENNSAVFGLQVIGNEFDEVVGLNHRLLIGAVGLSIEEIVNHIHELGGLAIASHIDRQNYSIISQLGFIPRSIKFDALELSQNLSYDEARKKYPECDDYTMIKNSDAHFLEDIGRCVTEMFLELPTFSELAKLFRKEAGRKVIVN